MKAKVVIALVAGVVLAGCGGDDDGEGAEQQNGDIAGAAQRLESYLKENTEDISGDALKQGERLQVVSSVRPAGGKLKIFTGLNADVTADDEPAQEICSVARKSSVPQGRARRSWTRATLSSHAARKAHAPAQEVPRGADTTSG